MRWKRTFPSELIVCVLCICPMWIWYTNTMNHLGKRYFRKFIVAYVMTVLKMSPFGSMPTVFAPVTGCNRSLLIYVQTNLRSHWFNQHLNEADAQVIRDTTNSIPVFSFFFCHVNVHVCLVFLFFFFHFSFYPRFSSTQWIVSFG